MVETAFAGVQTNLVFGDSIALDGSRIAVSVRKSGGQVEVHTEDSNGQWTGEAHFVRPSPAALYFGFSLDLSGSELLVGAPGLDSTFGHAYVFNHDSVSGTWDNGQRLFPSVPGQSSALGNEFGYSVAIGEQALVVGDPHGASHNGDYLGSAYCFRRDAAGVVPTVSDLILAADAADGLWPAGGAGVATSAGHVAVWSIKGYPAESPYAIYALEAPASRGCDTPASASGDVRLRARATGPGEERSLSLSSPQPGDLYALVASADLTVAPAQNVGFAGGYCLGMGRARVAGGPIAANQVAYVDESGLLPVGQQLLNTFGALHVQAYVLPQGGGPYWTNSVILR